MAGKRSKMCKLTLLWDVREMGETKFSGQNNVNRKKEYW